jgi:hypothetical protein
MRRPKRYLVLVGGGDGELQTHIKTHDSIGRGY